MKIPEKQGNGIVWLLTICLALQKLNVSQYMLNYCGVCYLMQNIKLAPLEEATQFGSKETRYSLKIMFCTLMIHYTS